MGKIYLDRNKCIGCSLCANLDEAHFEMVDGKARPKDGVELQTDIWVSEIGEGSDTVTQAIELCPTTAIIIDKDTN